jgi:hypothetical protein
MNTLIFKLSSFIKKERVFYTKEDRSRCLSLFFNLKKRCNDISNEISRLKHKAYEYIENKKFYNKFKCSLKNHKISNLNVVVNVSSHVAISLLKGYFWYRSGCNPANTVKWNYERGDWVKVGDELGSWHCVSIRSPTSGIFLGKNWRDHSNLFQVIPADIFESTTEEHILITFGNLIESVVSSIDLNYDYYQYSVEYLQECKIKLYDKSQISVKPIDSDTLKVLS